MLSKYAEFAPKSLKRLSLHFIFMEGGAGQEDVSTFDDFLCYSRPSWTDGGDRHLVLLKELEDVTFSGEIWTLEAEYDMDSKYESKGFPGSAHKPQLSGKKGGAVEGDLEGGRETGTGFSTQWTFRVKWLNRGLTTANGGLSTNGIAARVAHAAASFSGSQ
ncbi:hypothetical protein C8Q75DRAFT_737456 [Abortiporus biennis]|nr:hypothetical protein C8Q75DRAFT_737456 [Abortiporus biennis]